MRHGAEHHQVNKVGSSKQKDRCLKRSAEVWPGLFLLRTDRLPRDGTERAAYYGKGPGRFRRILVCCSLLTILLGD